MTQFIAVSNRRGGVGKTTVSVMLAYGLAVLARQRVLLIDLDAQASTSIVMMGHARWSEARASRRTNAWLLRQMANDAPFEAMDYVTHGIGDVVLPDGKAPILDIMPSTHDLDECETKLIIAQQSHHYQISDLFLRMQERMRLMIRSFDGCYDRVVIDCAPGLSQLVWGALKAADLALIPYIPDRTAEDNVGWLAGRLAEVAQTPFRTVPNRVSGQDRRAEGIIAALAEQFPSLDVRIPATQALATALDFREPAGSLASKFTRATDHVSRLVDAVLELPECLATEAA